MSYEIYYDRAFIRVNDRYVPLVNQGSNNCWEYNYFSKREIPEKNWQVLNWRDRSRLLYTEAEVREIARDYEKISQHSGTCFKSRYRSFGPDEFERWILCGIKSAFTIEEYVSAGNRLEINDFSAKETKDWECYSFSSTEEFLTLIDTLKGHPRLNIHFENNRQVYRPAKVPKHTERPEEYYVLRSCADAQLFFCKMARRGYFGAYSLENDGIRIFKTELAARRYMEKYTDRLTDRFEIKKVRNTELADTEDSVSA